MPEAALRQILHVDMDAFYASVEEHDQPELRGKPVVVGGPSRRGVVCAASYEARRFGVRSAMPMVEAIRRCPDAIVIRPRMQRYAEVSRRVFSIFERYTPDVEGLSLDEAFLDVTHSRSLFGDGPTIARRIQQDILSETGLTCSAGVAKCKLLAKIASDLQKPAGLVVVPEDAAAFLAPLPIERMWGIGAVTASRLHGLGYHTIGNLAEAAPGTLTRALGRYGQVVWDLAHGVDPRQVDSRGLAKSIGSERTLEVDLVSTDAIEKTLLDHASRIAERMVRAGLWGRVVSLKLKFSDFTRLSRQSALEHPICDTQALYTEGCRLLRGLSSLPRGVRLTGLSISELSHEPLMLFRDSTQVRREKLERVSAAVADRYGPGTLLRVDQLSRK